MNKLIELVALELATLSGFAAIGPVAKKLEKDLWLLIAENLSRPPKTDMGDLALGCFKLAKELNLKPNELAAKLAGAGVGSREAGGGSKPLVESLSAAGPYVNLGLHRGAAFQAALQAVESSSPGEDPEQWRFGNSDEGDGKTLVLDFSSPNIAKPLAVHHLRSTMIGNAIKKTREACGWKVVGLNHVGDWGTGFGKLIAGIKKYFPEVVERARRAAHGENTHPLEGMSVRELNSAYQRFSEDVKHDQDLEDGGRKEFSLLFKRTAKAAVQADIAGLSETEREQASVNFEIWADAKRISYREFARVYAQLGVSFGFGFGLSGVYEDYIANGSLWKHDAQLAVDQAGGNIVVGESFYDVASALTERVIQRARQLGIAEMSDGALVMFIDQTRARDKDGNLKVPPVMLLKKDGATSYHTRDLAAAVFRYEIFSATGLAYVVGGEQGLHFKQLFKALEMLGYEWAKDCTHVDFGLMLFKNDEGKWEKTSTRRGTAIMLEDLLDEAVKSVHEIMAQKNPELANSPDAERIAHAVGVGAVVFNDLKNGRRNNVKFDWDAVLDFEGESGPYMQYQFVRMGSVRAKFEEACKAGTYGAAWKAAVPDLQAADAALLTLPEEWAILQLLADFPAAVARASREYEPSIVARALIDLASATSTWWSATKDTRIVGDNPNLSLARVRLVNAIRKVLGRGLTLLGMSLVERM